MQIARYVMKRFLFSLYFSAMICSGRLFAALDKRLQGQQWPDATVDWLKSKLSEHSWRVRHFLIKYLMAESLGKQWKEEVVAVC